MRQIVGSGVRECYDAAIAGVWIDLRATLYRLESLAADPAETLAGDDAAERLAGLQYSLHRSAELVTGLEPPLEAESAHDELGAAVTEARDATAEIAYLVEAGDVDAAESYVYEWRGALFRVRLARLRLSRPTPGPAQASAAHGASARRKFLSWAVVGSGAVVLAAGVIAGLWAVAAAGLAASVVGGLAGSR